MNLRNFLRKITDQLPKGKRKAFKKHIANYSVALHVRAYLFVFLVLLAGVLLQILVILNGKYVEAKDAYAKRLSDYTYWSSVANQFPNVPDILYNAAVSSLAMGKDKEAVAFLQRAIKIDPLFEKAQELHKKITTN